MSKYPVCGAEEPAAVNIKVVNNNSWAAFASAEQPDLRPLALACSGEGSCCPGIVVTLLCIATNPDQYSTEWLSRAWAVRIPMEGLYCAFNLFGRLQCGKRVEGCSV